MYKWGLDALMVKLSSTILKEDDDDDGAVDDNDDENYEDKDCRKDHTDWNILIDNFINDDRGHLLALFVA